MDRPNDDEGEDRNKSDPMETGDAGGSDSPPPRLMITKMVLENFKSYAGVKEIGPFHKCFSAVVGPNGSGKSNVIDAMLFVFGKRAKKLRLNKVSELIHSSDAVKNCPPRYAQVSVFFQEIIDTGDGDDDYEVVPNSEIVVSRVAKRDNSSNYKLGGKNCAFKEVATFLNSKGIDLNNNRFLILQGEVEMISMMPPKGKTEDDEGLLEYLEDIIGSNRFVEDTKLAESKVEALSEQRQERLNRVKGVEKEMESLEGAKVEAEALLRKEREIRRKQNILYQKNAVTVSEDLAAATEKRDSISEKLERERSTLKEADQRVIEIEKRFKAKSKEHEVVSENLRKAKDEFSKFERQDIKLREDIKHGKDTKKQLESKVLAEKKKYDGHTAKAEKADEDLPKLKDQIKELTEIVTAENEKLEQIHDEMREKTEQLRHDLEAKNKELAPVQQERAVFQAALDTAITEAELIQDSTSRAQEQLTAVQSELNALDDKQESLRTDLSKCKDDLSESKDRILKAKKESEDLATKEKALAKRHGELVSNAEEAKANFQALNCRSKAVQSILRSAKKGGELSNVGVLGRLGDLGSIAEAYDVAVSTACGMLDHIVVKSTAGAQRCVEFLRKHGLGRANFIPLDKMKKGAHDRAVETPENAPRLFDLISVKHFEIAPAMYLAVGNTLVADDLDTASRWAYDYGKRWRVVTKDGKLIETSGTMAGGGKSVKRGGMRISNARARQSGDSADTTEEDFARVEAQAKEVFDELQKCRTERRKLEDEIRALGRKVKSLTVLSPKLTMQIEGCNTSREELSNRLPDLQKQTSLSEEDTEKLQILQAKVTKCKSDMAACESLASKLEKEVAVIQKAILDAGGSKLKKQQAACEKAKSDRNDTNKTLNKTKVAASTARKAATKAEKAQQLAEKELGECVKAIDEATEELKDLEEKAFSVMQAYEAKKEEEKLHRKELDACVTECDELKKSQSEIKCVEVELVGQVEHFAKLVKDNEKRAKHWQDEISRLHSTEDQEDLYESSDDEDEDDGDSNTHAQPENEVEDAEEERAKDPEKSKQSHGKKSSLPLLPKEALEQYDMEEIRSTIALLEEERDTLAKNANMGAIEEYRKKEKVYLSRVAELDEISEQRNEARRAYEELRRLRLETFMDGFGQITLKLKEMYQMITLGGDAELELVDSLDPFSEGIVFSVRPPKKSWKNIANLSGGEKTLSSLALVFALHHFRPTPLYVMDEIDAALDFKNVSIVSNYIKERTKNAQFIIISLRNNMFELADRLVGIYKTDNCTKSVTVNPHAFGAMAEEKRRRQSNSAALADKTNTLVSPRVGTGMTSS